MTATAAATEAAPTEPNAEGLWVCPVRDCDRAFSRRQGVVRHLGYTHGFTETKQLKTKSSVVEPTPDMVTIADVRSELKEIVAPLRMQRDAISRRLSHLDNEAQELRKTRSEIETILKRLDPSFAAKSKPTSTNPAGYTASLETKTAAVRKFLIEHGDEFPDGFTPNALGDYLRERNFAPAVSSKTIAPIIEQLRDEGIIRADRIARGGGQHFVLISNPNGGSSDGET